MEDLKNLAKEIDIEKILELSLAYGTNLIMAILTFVVGKWIARSLSGALMQLLRKQKVDETLLIFLGNIIYYILMVLVLISTVGRLGVDTTSFMAVLGAAGLAIGLALKDSLSNLASGVLLIMFRPFRIGDFVKVGGVSGTVSLINIFNTELTTPDNKKILVPNGNITTDIIENATSNDKRRVDMVFGISYDDDILLTKAILNQILDEDARVLQEPARRVALSEHGESSVNFVVRPWVKTEDYWNFYFDMHEKVKIAFDKEGITIPYPQQDVHLHNVVK